MNERVVRNIEARLTQLAGSAVKVRFGTITATSPLSVDLGSSGTPYTNVKAVNGTSLAINDVVAVLVWGNDLIVLGGAGDGTSGPGGAAGGDLTGTFPNPTLRAGLAREGTASTVVSELLVTPQSALYNGIVVKGIAGWDGTQAYGKAQGFMLLRDDNTGGESLYGTTATAPDRDVLYRIDGRTGGLGTSGGAHYAVGLRQHAGFTATQNVWIQNYLDTVALALTGASNTPASDYILANHANGNIAFEVTANGLVNLKSQTSGDYSVFQIGRGSWSAAEGQLAVVATAGTFGTATAVGDVVLRNATATKALRLGVSNSGVLSLSLPTGGFTADFKSEVAGDYAAIDIGRTALEAQLVIPAVAAQGLAGSAVGDFVIRALTTGKSLRIGVASTEVLTLTETSVTSSQPLAMSAKKITGLAAASANGDALRYEQVVGVYALLASPTFTGTPAAPTAAVDTNTTQVATTAYVLAQASASGDGTPAMDGTAARGTGTHFARNDHVHPTDTSLAPLASPALTGTPTAPTAAVGTNTTQLASTAFVLAQAASATPLVAGTAAVGTSTRYARGDHVHPAPAVGASFWPQYLGTASASAAVGQRSLYLQAISIPHPATITGIKYYVGGTQNGNVLAGLYDSTGALVAQSNSTVQGAHDVIQFVAFTGTYAALAGLYYIAWESDSATATAYRGVPMSASNRATQGTFTLPASPTLPTITTVDTVGVVVSTY